MNRLLLIGLWFLPMIGDASSTISNDGKTLCQFAPENDMRIPVNAFLANNEVTEEVFHQVLDLVDQKYRPKFAAQGATLEIQRDWENSQVNAFARQEGSTWIIKMFGGLARHPNITADGFAMVACHEIGHHLAGAPKRTARRSSQLSWASNEGQSDYFSSLKCARFLWENMEPPTEPNPLLAAHPLVADKCSLAFPDSASEQAICRRSALAGLASTSVLAALRREPMPSFDRADTVQARRTVHSHPRSQCRLDTYFAGALCGMDKNVELSNNDPNVGTCSRAFGDIEGVRPRCWYQPDESLNSQPVTFPLPIASIQ